MIKRDLSILSDAHKDARGFRPSADTYRHWATLSDADFAKLEDDLFAEVEAEIEREREAHAVAAASFEEHIAGLMSDHSIDRATAIRWDLQAMEAEEAAYGLAYYAYLHGLPTTYFGEA